MFQKDFRDNIFIGIPACEHIVYLPNLDDMDDEDDALVDLEELPGLTEFLEKVPIIDLTKDNVKYIKIEELDDIMGQLANISAEKEALQKENLDLREFKLDAINRLLHAPRNYGRNIVKLKL